MATSVNNAFSEFISKYVNILNTISDSAKSSRDFLFQQISCLSNNGSFLKAAPEYNICFGSFARKTKISPLDDIDIIVGLNGSGLEIEGNQWNNINLKLKKDCSDKLLINASDTFAQYWSQNIYYLNSNKVKNKLVSALQGISQYDKSSIHARGEAVTLKLKTYEWNFDIVPAFYYSNSNNSEIYYLIPNGYGKWKKTNPRIEQNRVSDLNKSFNNVVLPTIRLVKYWNRHGQMPNIASYILETIVLDYFSNATHSVISNGKYFDYPDMHFRSALSYISNHIMNDVYDSKGIQGNINNLMYDQKYKIKTRALNDYLKADEAVKAETIVKDNKKSINIWRSIFGEDFPQYG